MQPPQNYQTIIDDAIKHDWHFLTKRADIFPLPLWLKLSYSSCSQTHLQLYNTYIPWACVWHGDEMELYLHGEEYRRAVAFMTKMLYSLDALKTQLVQLNRVCDEAINLARFFYEPFWSDYTNYDLAHHFTQIANGYGESFVNGFFTWCAQVVAHEARAVLENHADAISSLDLTIDSALGILIVFDQPTLYSEKEKALDELAAEKESPDLNEKIKSFLQKYRWVSFDYNGPVITDIEVKKSLPERHQIQNQTVDKNTIIAACGLSADEQALFTILSLVSYAKDLRNQTDDYVHFCFDNFFAEVGKRFNMEKSDLKFLWPYEVVSLLRDEAKYDLDYFHQKKEYCAAVSLAVRIGLQDYYVGSDAQGLSDKLLSMSGKKVLTQSQQLAGTIASSGNAIGRAKLVYTFADVEKVQEGDILVAYMTSPRFMSAIIRCAAIVTDDGGLTCHAAIIAREIKKPCIVGTKMATAMLRDGDLVEVDADKGIVRKM